MSKLKPCPFCGGEAKLLSTCNNYLRVLYWVECNECESRTLKFIEEEKDKAIEVWNKVCTDDEN